MDKPKAIIFSGYAGSGKDTAADHIIEKYNSNKSTDWRRFALADPVRTTVTQVFQLDLNQQLYLTEPNLKNQKIPGCNYSGREMCQMIGDGMRHITFENVWCENLYLRYQKLHKGGRLIITDNRYPNEPKFFEKYFEVHTIRIERPNKDGNVGISNHPSESHIIPTEFTITNDGTIEDLYNAVDKVMRDIL